jgi:hypothetical protein
MIIGILVGAVIFFFIVVPAIKTFLKLDGYNDEPWDFGEH